MKKNYVKVVYVDGTCHHFTAQDYKKCLLLIKKLVLTFISSNHKFVSSFEILENDKEEAPIKFDGELSENDEVVFF